MIQILLIFSANIFLKTITSVQELKINLQGSFVSGGFAPLPLFSATGIEVGRLADTDNADDSDGLDVLSPESVAQLQKNVFVSVAQWLGPTL
jgi:hypothetical protein